MTIDANLVLFSTNVTQAYRISTGATTVVNNGVTVGGKTAPTVTDATGTNWLVVPDLDQIGQASPMGELTLGIYFSAGTGTGGGNTGTITFTPTLAFSDDASTVKSSQVLSPITLVVTAGVLGPQYAQSPIKWTSNHKFIRVNWTMAYNTITSGSLTNFTVALENFPDSGIGRVGTNIA